jgi:hypothetical protein
MLRIVLWIVIGLPVIYVADRVLLEAERRGWIYYRTYDDPPVDDESGLEG